MAAVFDDLDPLKTLVIIASKSGTTTEPNAFLAYFWDLAHKALDKVKHHVYEKPGGLMAVITDPGKSFEAIPHHDEFRDVFLNPPDIGGRYSALTYVGLVPASLIGLDLDALLASAHGDAWRLPRARPGDQSRRLARHRDGHPGQGGPRQADLPRRRRDRLVRGVGRAADRGKHRQARRRDRPGRPGAARGTGCLRPGPRLRPARPSPRARTAAATPWPEQLEAAGHPVIRIELADPIDLGGEFVRWEVATAIAGVVLGIDPFDQPNVEEAKELTRERAREGGSRSCPIQRRRGLAATDPTLTSTLAAHLGRPAANAYLALQAFIAPTPARDEAFARIRAMLRDAHACRHDRRLRPALPPLDRPAAQGRPPDRHRSSS